MAWVLLRHFIKEQPIRKFNLELLAQMIMLIKPKALSKMNQEHFQLYHSNHLCLKALFRALFKARIQFKNYRLDEFYYISMIS